MSENIKNVRLNHKKTEAQTFVQHLLSLHFDNKKDARYFYTKPKELLIESGEHVRETAEPEFHHPTKTLVLPPKIDETIQESGSMMVNQSCETKPMTASVDTIPIIFV